MLWTKPALSKRYKKEKFTFVLNKRMKACVSMTQQEEEKKPREKKQKNYLSKDLRADDSPIFHNW
jgi:hypothetical protein